MANPKQVIVLRRDLIESLEDFFGKYCAMAGHASTGAFLTLLNEGDTLKDKPLVFDENGVAMLTLTVKEGSALHIWLTEIFTKVCVFVDSEEQLKNVYTKAKDLGLPAVYIRDNGLTLFRHEVTPIAVGIGPAERRKIDKVTRGLPTGVKLMLETKGKTEYLVATAVGGLMEQPEWSYHDIRIVTASDQKEAEQIYNREMKCDYFYAQTIGIAAPCSPFEKLN